MEEVHFGVEDGRKRKKLKFERQTKPEIRIVGEEIKNDERCIDNEK